MDYNHSDLRILVTGSCIVHSCDQQEAALYTAWLTSLCSHFVTVLIIVYMTLEISCSLNDAIGTVVVILKQKQLLNISSLVYSTLKGRQVNVIVNKQNYSILCVVKTLFEESSTSTTMYIPNNSSSKEDTDENNIMVSPAILTESWI